MNDRNRTLKKIKMKIYTGNSYLYTYKKDRREYGLEERLKLDKDDLDIIIEHDNFNKINRMKYIGYGEYALINRR